MHENATTHRTTYKEKLRPSPAQERELQVVLWRCRALYNAGLEQRITAWQRRRVSLSRCEQEAELKAIRAEFPEYAAIHSHVLQDVLARLDKTYQAFFRRVKAGEKAGFPRFQGRTRHHSFTYKEDGNGARQRLRRLAGLPAGTNREPVGLLAPVVCQAGDGGSRADDVAMW